jgi:hypothetical protein
MALNQLIKLAVAEKISALRTEEFLLERGARANTNKARKILKRAEMNRRRKATKSSRETKMTRERLRSRPLQRAPKVLVVTRKTGSRAGPPRCRCRVWREVRRVAAHSFEHSHVRLQVSCKYRGVLAKGIGTQSMAITQFLAGCRARL